MMPFILSSIQRLRLFPSGTVTFLFTDIEGSTQLWERYPTAMHATLAQHDAILRTAVESRHGAVVKTTGDLISFRPADDDEGESR